MNDFFNVLDDFALEEIAPADEPGFVSTFSLDTADDSSAEVGPATSDQDEATYGDAALNDVKTDKSTITTDDAADDGNIYVWSNGTNPFSGTTAGVYFAATGTTKTDGGADGDITYIELSLSSFSGISFTNRVSSDNPLRIANKSDGSGIEISGSAATSFTLDRGNVTGGYFNEGTGEFTLGTFTAGAGPATYTNGNHINVKVEGFSDPTDTNAFAWTGDPNNFEEITTTGYGTVTVTNDYNFTVDEHEVKIKNVAPTGGGSVAVTLTETGVELNLSTLTQDGTNIIQVTEAADATILTPPADTDNDGDSTSEYIKIGKTTYNYALGAATSTAHFTLNSDGTVEGFVLDVADDKIFVDGNQTINVYDDEDTSNPVTDISGTGYTIEKTATGYIASITDDATVTIGTTTFEFDLKTALTAANAVQIAFDEDGEITGVTNINKLTNTADTLTVTGAPDGLLFDGAAIETASSNFTINGGAAGAQTLAVASGDTIEAVYANVEAVTTTGTGTIVDGINGLTYTYGGSGYFRTTPAGGITGFVFTSDDDFVTVPDGGEGINFYYLTETTAHKLAVPAFVDTDGFTVTADMTDATNPLFTFSNLSEGTTVPASGPVANSFVTEDEDDTVTVDLAGNITGIDNFTGTLELLAGAHTMSLNGDDLTWNTANNITITGDGNDLTQVIGLGDGDVVTGDGSTAFVFATDSTDGVHDIFTVNGKIYRVVNDKDGVTITGDGVVTGLDEDAHLHVSEGPVTVNGAEYSADDITTANATGEQIIGYNTKAEDTLTSFATDYDYPIFYSRTTAGEIMYNANWLNLPAFGTDQIFRESNNDNLDRSSDSAPAEVIFDANGISTSIFNNLGKNVAWVTAAAEGTKNIILGNHGDAVIMQGDDEYGQVNITVGSGHDTIWVGGTMENDKVVHKANMKTVIDMGGTANTESVDKIHTYAAANANIVLNNYDETGISGVVLHDPEIPYAKDLVGAIQDELLIFEDGGITAIDRDEFDKNESVKEGTDRKTRITVNNINENHQNMIRLFGYKDGKDTYGDDYGQLVGFTDKAGGAIDASDIDEDLILIGNMNGSHTGGSSLKAGVGNDTIFAGGQDTIDAGDGVDLTILDATEDRDAATIIVGKGAGDVVQNVDSGFNGDIFDVTSFDGKLEYEYADGVLGIKDNSSKSTLLANTDAEGEFIKQRFINGSDTLYAAIAKEEGTITVTDADDTVPNYYLANNGAIDFSGFSGEVHMDVDGEDLDWSGANQVGSTSNVTLGSGVNSLIGGSGTTIFKGGKADETLVAGTGESSLYGGGGKNLLIGNTSEDKVESTEFFNIGIHNGAQNTIQGFEFIENGGTNQATFDNLNLGLSDNNDVTDIQANADGSVTVAIKGVESGATEKVTIMDAVGKEFLVDRGTQTETVAQIAATEVTVNNSYVDFYTATDDANGATVKVGDIASTEIWLDAPDYGNGVDFSNSKFTVVDARGSNAEVLIAGNDLANTIYGGAGSASMWGGSGQVNDVMYAGTGHNEFYFESYNGNDTIYGAKDGDVIQLGVTLDQIDFDNTNVTATGVEIRLTDGSSLIVEGSGNVDIVLDDGTTAKVNHATQSFE